MPPISPEIIAWTAGIAWSLVNFWNLLFGLHAFRPLRTEGVGFVFGFFSSWLTIELAPHFVVGHVLIGVIAYLAGALTTPVGWIGLFSGVAVVGLYLYHWRQGLGATRIMRKSLEGVADPDGWTAFPLTKFINPFRPGRRDVSVTKDVEYGAAGGHRLKLDVYQPKTESHARRPAIIQIHGGAWIIGDKREQGLPLLNHLAAHGWVGFNVNYRLSPGATFPEHLIDIKRAIAWIRANADEYGIDPDFVAVTGGSAGGHLAAMMALTSDDLTYQPGFEDADTSVQACVPLYAVYDFVDRLDLLGPIFRTRMMEQMIMKTFFDDDPDAFHLASPLDRVNEDAPPFLVIHGDRDTLAPVEYADMFVERLLEVATNEVRYAKVEGAQHAFDVFLSPRTARVISGVERFLNAIWLRHQAAATRSVEEPAEEPTSA